MGAAGITILMVALLFGWEALVHFRKVSASSPSGGTVATGSTPTGGSSPTGSSATGSGGTISTASLPSSQPGTGGSSQIGGQYATKTDIAYIIQQANQLGIDPTALLAIAAHESSFQTNNDTGDSGKSWGLFQLNSNVWSIPFSQAITARGNTDFWVANFGGTAKRLYDQNGGTAAFLRDPQGFLQGWVPAVQVSDPWTPQMATDALGLVGAYRSKYGV